MAERTLAGNARGHRARRGRSPQMLLVLGFGALILVGAGVLSLQCCHRDGALTPLDALFTATSAVCVTGLTVVDTSSDLTVAGQIVVLILIQAGGLGVMTFAALAYRLLGRRISLRAHNAGRESLAQQDLGVELRSVFLRAVRISLLIEFVGAVVLFFGLRQALDPLEAAGSAAFHSVSAFCNAGFSIRGDNLVGLRSDGLVLTAIAVLVLLGGIGQPVLMELGRVFRAGWRPWRPRSGRLGLHVRVALSTSVLLLVFGAIAILLLGLPASEDTLGRQASAAVFQSVSSRTAGFNTVDIGTLPTASLLVLCCLMFIGGSPGSCAGGIKTTTFAVWFAHLRSWLRGVPHPHLFCRRIPTEISRRAGALIGLAILWNLAGIVLLTRLERTEPLEGLLFEQVSAFGTVGLSTGLTATLSGGSKVWVVLTMFVGRLGPLTLALCLFDRRPADVQFPGGRLMIG